LVREKFFHCTQFETTAAAILIRGFVAGPEDPGEAAEAMELLSDVLKADLQKQVRRLLQMERDSTYDLDSLYQKHLGHGTLMWVSLKVPHKRYGDWCFEVTLPTTALVVETGEDVYLAWVPQSPIHPRHFRLLPEEGLVE
jgi:hypothetical protein